MLLTEVLLGTHTAKPGFLPDMAFTYVLLAYDSLTSLPKAEAENSAALVQTDLIAAFEVAINCRVDLRKAIAAFHHSSCYPELLRGVLQSITDCLSLLDGIHVNMNRYFDWLS